MDNKRSLWTTHHINKYNWLYNYIKQLNPNINKSNFINVYKDQLVDIIHSNPKWGNSAKESIFFLIARWLELNTKSPYINIFKSEGWKLKEKKEQDEELNQLDNKEKDNYRSRNYFINILNNIDPNNIDNIIDHYKYLLLTLLVKQPPLRPDFYRSAKIINNIDKDDNINNFIYINRRGSLKAYYIINKDKVSNYKLYNMKPNLKKIEIIDDDVIKLLDYSFKTFPRRYLFEINGKQISYDTILKWLRNITKVNNINFDIMRSSYITWFYKNKSNYSDKNKLAKQMRHTVKTAMINYNKIDDTDINDNVDNNGEDIGLFKKRRKDIVYRIRMGNKPKESTLKKYNIKMEDYETKLK